MQLANSTRDNEVEPIFWTELRPSSVRIPALLPVIGSPFQVNTSFD